MHQKITTAEAPSELTALLCLLKAYEHYGAQTPPPACLGRLDARIVASS
ncbi:hypothetical protein [Pelagibius sp.]|nr:hypothetical protein [Pelagibius sp.]